MPLRIVQSTDERLVSPAVVGALRTAVERDGRAVLLVPTRTQAVQASRELVEEDLALGVTVDTPQSWSESLWEVFGNGTHPVEGIERLSLLSILLYTSGVKSISSLPHTSGTISALAQLAAECAAWLPLKEDGSLDVEDGRIVWLSSAEQEILVLVGEYLHGLESRNLIELSQIMHELPRRMASLDSPAPVVLSGFTSLKHAAREFVCDLAATTDVTAVFPAFEGPSGELARTLAKDLSARAQERSVEVESGIEATVAPEGRAPELQALLEELFTAGPAKEAADSLTAEGSVRMLEAAGPLAEGTLIAEEIAQLQAGGAKEVVLCVSDVERAWNECAPKLAAKGFRVRGALTRKGIDIPQVRTLIGFAQELAYLAELDWPEPLPATEGTDGKPVPVLGDMSWWPPRRISDFLLSELSGLSYDKAWNLDARFRGDRMLSPARIFEMLQREALTSRGCVQATGALLQGRLSQAAGYLYGAARSEEEGTGALTEEALSALALVQQAAESLHGIGLRFDPNHDPESQVPKGRIVTPSLSTLYALARQIIECLSIVERREVGPEDVALTVRICTRAEAAMLPSCSADAVVVSELTTEGWPVRVEEGAVEHLLEALDLAPREDGVAQVRSIYSSVIRAARDTLVLERALRDADSAITYPAIALTETLASYGLDVDDSDPAHAGIPVVRRAETAVSENLSATGTSEEPTGSYTLHPTGEIGERSRDLVVVAQVGSDAPEQGGISLSASQIESYLECPYKWFTLRRLGLRGVDADFSAMEMGSFVHRVLEQTRSHALLNTLREQGIIGEGVEVEDLPAGISYIPEAAVSASTHDGMQKLLEACIREDLDHQALTAHARSSQSLIPHSFAEEARLTRAAEDLHSLISWEQGVLSGFSPRHFELRFGGREEGSCHVQYAGVDLVGTIDRIDVDAQGRAIVIDYKHKSPSAFDTEYDVFPKKSKGSADFALPRRVQSLIYAQIVRRLHPELDVRGAVYISTRSDGRGGHALAGVLDPEVAHRVMGELDSKREPALVAGGNNPSFTEVLDLTEELIAQHIASLREGEILADPSDKRACEWCPALRCERRLS